MKKDIKDYLPFYLGCEMINPTTGELGFLHSVNMEFLVSEPSQRQTSNRALIQLNRKAAVISAADWKPILRKLSDMTEEGCADVYTISRDRILHESSHDFHVIKSTNGFMIHRLDWLNEPLMLGFNGQIYSVVEDGNKKHIEPVRNQHEITKYLLSKHFDLFGLIECGLAIDKSKLAQPA